MNRDCHVFMGAFLLWLVLVLLRFLFYFEILDELSLLADLVDLGLFGLAFTLVIFLMVQWFSNWKKWWAPALVLTIIALGYLAWVTPLGMMTGVYFRLARWEGTYQRDIIAVSSGGATRVKGIRIEKGNPIRVAFSWGGMLDNWVGVVHDPSHSAADLRVSSGWFGGTMIFAKPLWGDWYFCRFT